MSTPQEQVKIGGLNNESTNATTLIEEAKCMGEFQGLHGTGKVLNSELWHACAGPLVSLPQPSSLIYYFPQGHTEQVTASTRRTANSCIPSYPTLPSQMMCQVQTVTLHADKDTDEIFAQMTLQPVSSGNKAVSTADMPLPKYRQPYEFFCKTLTASDTSTHGGFSVPRRAGEKLFPELDYSMQPPNQELVVRDLHENLWTFRHIYRGQPKRHLLTTGWSVFVGAKRLKAGDSVLFIRDEKSQLFLGVRRVNHQQSMLPSSVLSADSMHMGVLAAAAHAAMSRSPFIVYYNPRACPSEFIVPLSKYHRAPGTQILSGMRFGMMFQTEDLNTRRYMGTIMGVGDCDPFRWPRSKWRSLQVEWDENGCVERPNRVSLWEIESLESLFVFAAPTLNFKRQYKPGDVEEIELENMIKRLDSRASENGNGDVIHPALPNLDSEQLLKARLQSQSLTSNLQGGYCQSIHATFLPDMQGAETILDSPTSAAWDNMVRLAQPKAVTESGKHQTCNLPFVQKQMPHMQNYGGQTRNTEQCLELRQHLEDSDISLSTHISQEQIARLSPSNKKEQVKNEFDEQESDSSMSQFNISSTHGRDAVKSDLTSAIIADQLDKNPDGNMSSSAKHLQAEQRSEFPSKNSEENIAALLKPEDLATQVLANQEPARRLHGDLLFMKQKFEQNGDQLPELEKSLADTTNTLPLYPHQHHISSEPVGDLKWMPNSSSLQPASIISKLHGFLSCSSKLDSLHCASKTDTDTSADISSVLNAEKFTSIQRMLFQCFPESTSSRCLPISGQGLLCTNQTNVPRHIAQIEQHGVGQLEDSTILSSGVHGMSSSREITTLLNGHANFSDETGDQSENYNDLHFEVNTGTMTVDPSVLSTEGFGIMGSYSSDITTEGLVGYFSTCQDIQSQFNCTSFIDSQAFSVHEFPDSSGGLSSSNLDFDDNYFLNKTSWKQVSQPLRTYTKVQKLGAVGRSIDVTGFRNYSELKSAIACLFGLEEQLDDMKGSGWKLVYTDYENDVLLVGDDPWEDFVSCVRCIRILSPSEVQQMSQEGLRLQNNYFTHQIKKNSFPEGGHSWDFQHF